MLPEPAVSHRRRTARARFLIYYALATAVAVTDSAQMANELSDNTEASESTSAGDSAAASGTEPGEGTPAEVPAAADSSQDVAASLSPEQQQAVQQAGQALKDSGAQLDGPTVVPPDATKSDDAQLAQGIDYPR